MAINAQDPITVASYGFSVPCRRFLISANVTRDKRLPVVDEFLLRILRISERIAIARLASFFGFTEREIETVLTDLASRGLIVVDDGHVSLHTSAEEIFRGSSDDNPRIMEIEPWIERIWFDLVSRNIMVPQRVRSAQNLVDLRADPSSREFPENFARSAFEQNFAEYLRKVRRIPDPDTIGLYSISHVEADRFGFVVVKGYDELTLETRPELKPRLLEVDIDSIARFQPLSNALMDAYRQLDSPSPTAAGLSDYRRLTGEASIGEFHAEAGHFNLVDWLVKEQSVERTDTLPIVGAAYLDRNLELFGRMATRSQSDRRSPPRSKAELVWVRPVGKRWGATPDLPESLAFFRQVARRAFGSECQLVTSLVCPQPSGGDSSRRFKRFFQNGFVLPTRSISPSIEVVLLRDVAGIVLVTVGLSASVVVSVGFVFGNPLILERIEQVIGLARLGELEVLWSASKGRDAPVDSDDVRDSDAATPIE